MGCHSAVSLCISVMGLRDLLYGRFRTPRYPDLTYEKAMDRIDEPWVRDYKRRGFPIRDFFTGRVNIAWVHQSSELQVAREEKLYAGKGPVRQNGAELC